MKAFACAFFTFAAALVSVAAAAQDGAVPEARRPLPAEAGDRCIPAENITGYRTMSDELIRFEMTDHDVVARLRKTCPQLHYHGYVSYQPVNGMLCAKFDDVVSRSGMPCRIESFTKVQQLEGDEPSPDTEKETRGR